MNQELMMPYQARNVNAELGSMQDYQLNNPHLPHLFPTEYHSPHSLGLSDLAFLAQAQAPVAAVGGWVELDRTILGSSNATIDVTSLADKRSLMVLCNAVGVSAGSNTGTQLNADTGNNYARRGSNQGGADTTAVNNGNMEAGGTSTESHFQVGYLANFATKEKLLLSHLVAGVTAGAGTAPFRNESVGKHAQTTNPISSYQWITTTGATFDTGSEVVVLGWDPADIHTTNFWEELASVELGSTSSTIDSGTFTAKKYLWVQLFNNGNSSGEEQLTFNSDTGSNYTRRFSANGGADSTNVNVANIENMFTGGTATNKSLGNGFIINNSANEKLLITHVILNNVSGAANAPGRLESACKWANTASQITKVTFTSTGGVFAVGSFLKIWGSN